MLLEDKSRKVMRIDCVSELVFLTNDNYYSCWFDRSSDCSCDSEYSCDDCGD